MDRYMGVVRLGHVKIEDDFMDMKVIENVETKKSGCMCEVQNEIAGADSGENIVIIDDSTIYEIDARCMNSKNSRDNRKNINNKNNTNNK